jgi:hypothetical protein
MRQRTMQSTWPGLLPAVLGAPGVENAGGGANCRAGLFGRITGGCTVVGVKPNWPGAAFCVPFWTLIAPFWTCTERPGVEPVAVGFGAGVVPGFGLDDGAAEADAEADGAGVGVGAAFVITALPTANEATLTAA